MSCSNNLHGMPGGLSILSAGEETEARGLIKVIQSCELGGGGWVSVQLSCCCY